MKKENKKLIKTYLNFKDILNGELTYIRKIKDVLDFGLVESINCSLANRERYLLSQIEIIDSNINYLIDKEK